MAATDENTNLSSDHEPPHDTRLKEVVQDYRRVAEAVNRREMERFLRDARKRWTTHPPQELEPRGEGYTDEGAFALHAYEAAFEHDPFVNYDGSPKQTHYTCEAEELHQVLLYPTPDAFIHQIEPPLSPPEPQDVIARELEALRKALQSQYERSTANRDGTSLAIRLPDDFKQLTSISNGINGAGVPAETAHTTLVYPLIKEGHAKHIPAASATPEGIWIARRGFTTMAAWEIGGCTQFRQIYYVLCYKANESPGDASWRIFDNNGPGDNHVFEDLNEFLARETTVIEARPGGHQQEGDVLSGW